MIRFRKTQEKSRIAGIAAQEMQAPSDFPRAPNIGCGMQGQTIRHQEWTRSVAAMAYALCIRETSRS
jgi:hypothetical protein